MNKKIYILLGLTAIFLVAGATFAYITWISSSTAVTFTVTPQFSCGADGGGDITGNGLAPAHCDNPNYAIKKEITVTHNTSVDIQMDLWLNVVSLAEELENSSNFKYALTTSDSSCEEGFVSGGVVGENITEDNKVYLLNKQIYSNSTPNTYFLYVWLDYEETDSSIMGKSFNFTLGGSCTDEIIIPNTLMVASSSTGNWLNTSISRGLINSITFTNSINGHEVNNTNTFDVSNLMDGSVLLWTGELNSNNRYDLTIGGNGGVAANPDSSYLFSNLLNLTTINFNNNFYSKSVINMSGMFYRLGQDSTNFSLNLDDKFDTRNVTNMWGMFLRMGYNAREFSLNLGDKFDTSNVINMDNMFGSFLIPGGAGAYATNFSLNLGGKFDTSNVTSMWGMFYGAGQNATNFNLNLGDKFDTSNVTSISSMFSNVGQNSTNFSLNLGDKFDTSNVTSMSSMFSGAGQNSTNFSLNLGDKFDTSNVTSMSSMFSGAGQNATNFNLNLGDKFDTSNVTSISSMFSNVGQNSTNFSLNLGDKFDTSNVKYMSSMFSNVGQNSTNFSLNLGDKFDTSNVTNMYYMFSNVGLNATNFSLNLGDKFDTSNVTTMASMFQSVGKNATNFNVNIGNKFYTTNVTDMSNMFGGSGFRVLNLSTFDINNTKLNDMFFNMKNLQTIITPRSFNTTNNTHFPRAFYDANDTAFTLLDSNIPLNTTLTFKADDGTEYTTAEGGGTSCITSDTMIMLADGSEKMVKDVTEDDLLLVWNLDTGEYDASPILFMDSDPEDVYEVIRTVFSDGTYIDIISEHGFFDIDLGKYVYLDNTAKKYIGHNFVKYYKDGWSIVKLTDVIIENRVVTPYSPVTISHLNYYTNGMLSMPGGSSGFFNYFDVDTSLMKYDEEKRAADIKKYGLYTYDDFKDYIPVEVYDSYHGKFMKISMAKGLITWDDIKYYAERYAPFFG